VEARSLNVFLGFDAVLVFLGFMQFLVLISLGGLWSLRVQLCIPT
jgi:isoprenylcysteine carboxyl methyltransferase (ICMT) family protein YpbQ